MSAIFMIFLSFARADVWSMQDVRKIMRAEPQENSYLNALCEAQLEQRRVPTACYKEADASLLRFLDERCEQWSASEKDLQSLKVWGKHPQVSARCLQKMRERIAELEYVQEEKNPLEYFRQRKLAQNLKNKAPWKSKSNRKPSVTNSSSVSAKD